MYWENIEGMFTFQLLYSNMIQRFPNNSVFVEIGTRKGKSSIFMAEKIKESGKNITFYTIDLFNGFGGGYDEDEDAKEKMEKKLKITKKDLITLILSKNNKTKPDLGLSLFNVMDKYKDSFNTCEIFLVERQMIVNRQALKLSHYLEAWLKINYPDKKVINYSASQKTKLLGAKNLKTKKDRKLWTVEYTLNLLQGETLEQFKQFRKQDDLADVVCMIESFFLKKK